jgi:hypothetical protein
MSDVAAKKSLRRVIELSSLAPTYLISGASVDPLHPYPVPSPLSRSTALLPTDCHAVRKEPGCSKEIRNTDPGSYSHEIQRRGQSEASWIITSGLNEP